MSSYSGLKNNEPWFNAIQGNILKPHGRNFHKLIMLTFANIKMQKEICTWIRNLPITTFAQQLEDTFEFRKTGKSSIFISFFLSASGYRSLGYSAEQLPSDPSFLGGMKKSIDKLQDKEVELWAEPYKAQLDAVILLAHDDLNELEVESQKYLEEISYCFGNDTILTVEFGKTDRDEKGFSHEPFGFRDGIGNPLFLEEDINKYSKEKNVKFDLRAPKEIVLVFDPNENEAYGSYVVLKKLEQNVKEFRQAENELIRKLGFKQSEKEKVAALFIGRYRNGVPLTEMNNDNVTSLTNDEILSNNWNFVDDPNGNKCPFHSHVRKVNDRGESIKTGSGFSDERFRRITRRGFTYNEINTNEFPNLKFEHIPNIEELPQTGIGTMFMSFQSSIIDQFEKIITNNVNNLDYFRTRSGVDAIIGKRIEGSELFKFTNKNGEPGLFNLESFINLKGGEYLFAPSVTFLKTIGVLSKSPEFRKGNPSSSRTKYLREQLLDRSFSNRKNEWFTKDMLPHIFKANPELINMPVIIRQAYASKAMLEAMVNEENSKSTNTYEILSGELIVGTIPMGSVGLGKTFPGYLCDEERRAASLSNRDEGSVFGHTVPNFGRILKDGLIEVIRFSEKKLKTNIANEKKEFYEAVIIVCDAVINYANAFADLAEKDANMETNSDRKRELLEIAKICRKVPAKPAESFHEALQCIWFIHLAQTSFCVFNSLGRLDQILNEYLCTDLNKKNITEEQALELLECFLIKGAQRINLNPTTLKEQDFLTFGTGIGTQPIYLDQIASCNNFIQNIVLGGIKKDGTDGTNTATYLFLRALGGIGLCTPTINVRVSDKTPNELLVAIDDAFRRAGNGHPILFNENSIINGLLDAGIPIDEARDFALAGCWEPMLHGKNTFIFGMVNILRVLECALNEGTLFSSDPQFLKGQKQSWSSPAPSHYKSFDELMDEVKKHMQFFADKIALGTCTFYQFPSSVTPTPFLSVLIDGCLERGVDQSMGGADYNIIANLAFAVPNAANALANIKKFVFEEKQYTLTEVSNALKANWGMSIVRNEYEIMDVNDEQLKDKYYRMRRDFLESNIKFGNDNDYVDDIAKQIMNYWYEACKNAEKLAKKAFLSIHSDKEGQKLRMMTNYPAESLRETLRDDFQIFFTSGSGTFGQYSSMGKGVNASSDGRAANESLVPNCSPMAGTAINGLEGLFKTLSKLDLNRFGCAVVTDIRIDGIHQPQFFFMKLIKDWVANGGSMLTVSVLSSNDVLEMIRLTDRVRNAPSSIEQLKKFADRFCRVGGWNSGFICLPRPQQRDHLLRATF